MKKVTKAGVKSLVKFKCKTCGQEWDSDEYKIDENATGYAKDVCDNCSNISISKLFLEEAETIGK